MGMGRLGKAGRCYSGISENLKMPTATMRKATCPPNYPCLPPWLLIVVGLLSGCVANNPTPNKLLSVAPVVLSQVHLETMASPVPRDTAGQTLTTGLDGKPVLAWWLQSKDKPSEVYVSVWSQGQWQAAQRAAVLPNIADVQVAALADGALAVLVLANNPYPSGGEVQTIYFAHSDTGHSQWSSPKDIAPGIAVSNKSLTALAALADGSLLAAWIDMPVSQPANKAGGLLPALRVSQVSSDGVISQHQADTSFCGCCAPTLASSGEGGLLAYRDLEPVNVRDPAIRRVEGGVIANSVLVHRDHWVFDGCPSSGPVISVLGDTVAVAWTTLVNNRLVVRAAFSQDGGGHFAKPVSLESEQATDVSGIVLENSDTAWVGWTGYEADGAMLKLSKVDSDGHITPPITMQHLADGEGYREPGPKLVAIQDGLLITWENASGTKRGLVKFDTTSR
jgi:hypothetical protein